jgi:hypothetical protein
VRRPTAARERTPSLGGRSGRGAPLSVTFQSGAQLAGAQRGHAVVVFGQESVGERLVPLLIGGKAVAAKGRLGRAAISWPRSVARRIDRKRRATGDDRPLLRACSRPPSARRTRPLAHPLTNSSAYLPSHSDGPTPDSTAEASAQKTRIARPVSATIIYPGTPAP